MKRKLVTIFSLIAVLAVLSGGTWAYFSTQAAARNTVSTGTVQLAINQRTAAGDPLPPDGEQIMPGDTLGRQITVQNTGDEPIYLRVKLIKGVSEQNLSAENCMTIEINTADWTAQPDGYYYYNNVLEAGQETPSLVEQIHFEGLAINNAYLGRDFTLDVEAYGVQSVNNSASPLTAMGWPAEASAQQ